MNDAWWRRGYWVVIGIVAVMIGGWFFYRDTLPPPWLRAFGADIATRASADPNGPPPEDLREASPRGLADHPYICVADLIPGDWDRIVFVGAGQDARANPLLAAAAWPDGGLEDLPRRMLSDDRYQGIVLLKGETVQAWELFFTFWADLSGIAGQDGFSRAAAVFTAASIGGTYVLEPATAPPGICKTLD